MKRILPLNLEIILVPVGLILTLFVLTGIALKVGLSRISEQRQELLASEKSENVLEGKEALLREVSAGVLHQAEASAIAVPDDNPALVVLAQLKNLAVTKGVTLDNLKIGNFAKDQGGISKVDLTFDVDGNLAAILEFAAAISRFSPLTTLEKVGISQSQGAARASVTLQAYWAPFPKTLPELTEPLKTLSPDETQLVSKLEGLAAPPFSSITPSGPSGRTDPFNF